MRHPLRVAGRLSWLAGECLLAAVCYLARLVRHLGTPPLAERARWLQIACRRVLPILSLGARAHGRIPERGLLVSNHLSYLDILVLASVTPCVFVAKWEVRRWPVFGWLARLAGTVFVRRDRRAGALRSTGEIRAALDEGVLVVLFPEGTTSGGETVLPFKSALLEAVIGTSHPATAAFLHYSMDDGQVAGEICYWRNMTLLPHLLNLLSKRQLQAAVVLRSVRTGRGDRKKLARQLHSEVLCCRNILPPPATVGRSWST